MKETLDEFDTLVEEEELQKVKALRGEDLTDEEEAKS